MIFLKLDCKENNINIIRNNRYFIYEYKNIKRKYYPDFIIDDVYIEIKGYKQPETDFKTYNFPFELKIISKNDIQPIIEYMKNKYGKNFCEYFYEK